MLIKRWEQYLLCVYSISFFRICSTQSYAGHDYRTGFAQDHEDSKWFKPETHDFPALLEDSGDWGDDSSLRNSNTMLHYVISKGCDYLMAFVKGHYYRHDDHHREVPSDCDWKPWVERNCYAYHIPPEVCCALMDCGATRSLMAFGESHSLVEKCNITSEVALIHGTDGVGRRNTRTTDPPSVSKMCIAYQSSTVFGKRQHSLQYTTLDDIPVPSVSLSSDSARTSDGNGFSLSEQVDFLHSWCKTFSMRVNIKYNLNKIHYIRSSVYWVVDIYKTAHKLHVPKSYTHGLVGCGMDYAMLAFNVQTWQTVLYRLVLE